MSVQPLGLQANTAQPVEITQVTAAVIRLAWNTRNLLTRSVETSEAQDTEPVYQSTSLPVYLTIQSRMAMALQSGVMAGETDTSATV
ncbi:hypothetical protein NUU61_009288 [Penicillium alfredii]|uniref:Uncharacterized protein n=1 Tax=Penicillium alfredii TaxID=1506179 RepID=A0A9W9EN11_9EURO|nr:uncharacterized protein NUU61_009288 [Penicillium alfredii]KAJ5084709.1 hypothetical protein NUU61_009288 [Penicillium alfredii]